MGKKKRAEFRFDAALSFAGRDRPLAEAVARAMQSVGLRVFYDKDHHAHLWGKSRTEYEDIYGPDSVFVVPIISEHYAAREWTQWEFETAKREARKRNEDFLLPIRLDDSRQFGLTDDHNYLGADSFTPEEIARALKTKLEAEFGQSRNQTRSNGRRASVLTTKAREALGLIVASPIPVTDRHLLSLFPDVAWPKHLRLLKRLELITDDVLIDVAKNVNESFNDELSDLESRWQARLEELQDHIDCALFLSLIYIKQERFDDAVLLVIDVAHATESNRWMPVCTRILEALNSDASLIRRLPTQTRLEFFRAFGHCLSASRRFDEARTQFETLRSEAARQKDRESVGIALLNIGTNYHKQGDIQSAVSFYESTRKHARKHKLTMLESHALGNLGQIEIEFDPEASIEILRESIELKKKSKDRVGIAGSMQVLGQAYAELGDFESAFSHYDEAELLARKLQLLHLEAVLLNNKANTLFEVGKRSEALRVFRKARKLAETEGFDDLHVRATEGIARVFYTMDKLPDALTYMEELLQLAKELETFEFVMVAHHGLWAANARLGDQEGASRHFQALTRLARKKKAIHWLLRGLVDRSRPIKDGNFGEVDPKTLKKRIEREARRGDNLVTAALWIEFAQISAPENTALAVEAIHKCIACCEGEPNMVDELLNAYEFLYTLHWDVDNEYDEAINTLNTLAAIAKRRGNLEKELAAIDQKGVCLQDLDRGSEAIPLHEHVADRARKHKLDWLAVNSLYNLGECHLRLGNTDAALRAFKKARKAAVDCCDEESVIQIDHGYALTLEYTGKFDDASTLFVRCRDQARKLKWWFEYFRACEAIANLSWTRGRKKTALKQYQKAFAECDDYDDVERKGRIAFNLSRLHRLLGNVHEAYKVLAKHIELIDDPFSYSDCHATLAELCEATDRVEEARAHWQTAVQAAEKVGDEDELAYCQSKYAEFERRHGDPKKSIRELKEMLNGKLSAENRGIALIQLFRALLQRKFENRAEEIFNTARKHLQKHGPTDRLIDLYMTLFDHNWIGDRDSRFAALQAYVGAFVAAASEEECEDSITIVVAHVSVKLTLPETSPSVQQLRWLEKRLEDWITEQSVRSDVIALLMHPLRNAEKLIPLNNDPVKFLEMHDHLRAQFENV
jgi:tetratricopeptide (TPR) repeat protein